MSVDFNGAIGLPLETMVRDTGYENNKYHHFEIMNHFLVVTYRRAIIFIGRIAPNSLSVKRRAKKADLLVVDVYEGCHTGSCLCFDNN